MRPLDKRQSSLIKKIMLVFLILFKIHRHSAATSTNPDIAFKLEIFEGVFLDTR